MACLDISGMKSLRETEISSAIPLAGAVALSERLGIRREGEAVPFSPGSNTDHFTVLLLITDAAQSTFLRMMHGSELISSYERIASILKL